MGHEQDEHQRDSLLQPSHEPAGNLSPHLSTLCRLGSSQPLATRPGLRPSLPLLRVRVQARRRRTVLLKGRVQVNIGKTFADLNCQLSNIMSRQIMLKTLTIYSCQSVWIHLHNLKDGNSRLLKETNINANQYKISTKKEHRVSDWHHFHNRIYR